MSVVAQMSAPNAQLDANTLNSTSIAHSFFIANHLLKV